jgi:penicillin-binding protein 2
VGNRLFICWKEEGHGVQNVTEAIKNSCNVFFYQLALFTGADTISKYAFKFGLGKPTGIDLAGEAGGFVPTESWKRRKFGTAWFKGETANFGIGQGYLLVTPIQVTHFIGAIANEGILVKPFVVNRIEDIILHHAVNQDVEVTAETISVLRNGMRKVVNEEHGTGMFAKSKDIVIAGKTGTAQNPKGKPHAWFAGFAPFENPKICVTVFIEHGGKGGLEPARFARKIIEKARALELL